MRERQIEAMYRARFDERRHATEALDALLGEASAGRDTATRAWFVAVAHPRLPRTLDRLSLERARAIFRKAQSLTLIYAGRGGVHPLESVEVLNPRPGLRHWSAVSATSERSRWREAWASIHHDGSVSLTATIGAHRMSSGANFEGWQVQSSGIECAVADFMALIRTTADAIGGGEYDARVVIAWSGEHPLEILTVDNFGSSYSGVSTPLHVYTPVEVTVIADASDRPYHLQVHDLAQDCVNQGGVSTLQLIQPPSPEEGGTDEP